MIARPEAKLLALSLVSLGVGVGGMQYIFSMCWHIQANLAFPMALGTVVDTIASSNPNVSLQNVCVILHT